MFPQTDLRDHLCGVPPFRGNGFWKSISSIGSFMVRNGDGVFLHTISLSRQLKRRISFRERGNDEAWVKYGTGMTRPLFSWHVRKLSQESRSSVRSSRNP
jgi:hypothetical protein